MTTEAVQELYAQLGRAVQDEEEAIAVYKRLLTAAYHAEMDVPPIASTIQKILLPILAEEQQHRKNLLYALELLQRMRTR